MALLLNPFTAHAAAASAPPKAAPGVRMGPVLLLGGLGVAGYFVYRHFKKKRK